MLWVAPLMLSACGNPLDPAYSESQLQQWNAGKAARGHTFAGSPEWQVHMDFLETGLADAGITDVIKLPTPHRRWWASDNPALSERNLTIDGEAIPVASYWAYSGATPEDGVTAPLVMYEKRMPAADMQGKIVVFQVKPVPDSLAKMFTIGNYYQTADFDSPRASIASDQWYQGNFVTRFGRFDRALRGSGAAGAIAVFAMSYDRLHGLYTFPLFEEDVVGVPGIYVDQQAGERVLAAAAAGSDATLTLLADEEEVEPYFYSAVLPGKHHGTPQDREIMLVTHSDGPNLTQENGGIAMLAMLRHFSRTPQSARNKSIRILLDPQHFSPGRHTINWYDLHPDIMQRTDAVVGVEHIGQLEFGEDANGNYGLTGLPEPWQIFVRNDPQLIQIAIDAVEDTAVPRTELRVPEIKGQGSWTGLAEIAIKRDIPGYGTLSDMSGYWSTQAGIDSFDAGLAKQQIDVLVKLIEGLQNR